MIKTNGASFLKDARKLSKEALTSLLEMMEADMENGFKGFSLSFQAIYKIDSFSHNNEDKTLVGYEVLARWNRSTPDVFIPLAEHSGYIEKISAWIIDELLKNINHFKQLNLINSDIRFYLNISGKQIHQNGKFLSSLKESLSLYGIQPRLLGVELTETVIIEDMAAAKWMVDNLREIGIEVALDDFGTGANGMNLLQELNVDKIKIDRVFVRVDCEKTSKILTSIHCMAQKLGIEVVVEGVETRDQLNFLVDLGFSLFQGFLLGRPVDMGLLR